MLPAGLSPRSAPGQMLISSMGYLYFLLYTVSQKNVPLCDCPYFRPNKCRMKHAGSEENVTTVDELVALLNHKGQ